jgi:spore coat protein JB
MQQVDPHYYEWLRKMQAVQFSLVEIQFYLDIYPDDPRAVNDYNYLSHQLHCLKHEYEQRYGPLMHFGFTTSNTPQVWIDTPWPWEIDYRPLTMREQEV